MPNLYTFVRVDLNNPAFFYLFLFFLHQYLALTKTEMIHVQKSHPLGSLKNIRIT